MTSPPTRNLAFAVLLAGVTSADAGAQANNAADLAPTASPAGELSLASEIATAYSPCGPCPLARPPNRVGTFRLPAWRLAVCGTRHLDGRGVSLMGLRESPIRNWRGSP